MRSLQSQSGIWWACWYVLAGSSAAHRTLYPTPLLICKTQRGSGRHQVKMTPSRHSQWAVPSAAGRSLHPTFANRYRNQIQFDRHQTKMRPSWQGTGFFCVVRKCHAIRVFACKISLLRVLRFLFVLGLCTRVLFPIIFEMAIYQGLVYI